MKLKIVKGTRDLYGDDVERFQFLEDKAREVFSLYGYEEIRTPMFERTELFAHGVGQDTDIVGKEMFLLEDRRGRSMALRPEMTASVVRSIITDNHMQQATHRRFYYIGPMFRYEQPQKGRFRQFYQIGAEYFGVSTPDSDAELLLMLRQYFKKVDLNAVSFQLNTIGCQNPDCRPAFKKNLVDFLTVQKEYLCENCTRRIDTNPLRVLDCKEESCIAVTKDAPKIYEHVCEECGEHFSELRSILDDHGVVYTLNHKLVRGLDYYSRTVFEVYSDNLGAQNAAGGGGRYDSLFEVYGSPIIPALGFALGLDRLAMLIRLGEKKADGLFVIGHHRRMVNTLVSNCREAGYKTLYDPFQSSMKSQFRQANKANVSHVLILGDDELKEGIVSVKNMTTSTQTSVPIDRIIGHIESELSPER
ncbi:histidine--tRNA ligase [bacterium]|nr:histidine--tRNA ligase [bacterium]